MPQHSYHSRRATPANKAIIEAKCVCCVVYSLSKLPGWNVQKWLWWHKRWRVCFLWKLSCRNVETVFGIQCTSICGRSLLCTRGNDGYSCCVKFDMCERVCMWELHLTFSGWARASYFPGRRCSIVLWDVPSDRFSIFFVTKL